MLAAHERLAEGSLNFVGNVEGFDLPDLGRGRDRDRRLHRQRRAEGARGHGQGDGRGGPRRDPLGSRSPRSAGCSIKGKLAGLRDQLDPERAGGAILLGLRKPVVVAHGSFGPLGIESAVRLAHRAVEEDMVGRTAAGPRGSRGLAVRARC